MKRRAFARGAATIGLAGLAGCTGMFETRRARPEFTTVENRAEEVYYPTHTEGMEMLGMGGNGRYDVGLMYSFPHAFWTITGADTDLNRPANDVSAHLMASVWDAETETVLPTANVAAEIRKDGETVDSRSLWTMLSQNMGYHFGDNVALDGDGTYTARLEIGAMQSRRMGALRDAFDEGAAIEVEFEHSREQLEDVPYERLPDKRGDSGAIEPMDMDMPIAQVPDPDSLPGALGMATSGDAEFVVFAPDANPHFADDGETYLAVSPRTPYNRYPLPFMSLSATLSRDGETIYDGALEAAVDPDLGYHYGAAVESVASGDDLAVSVDAPPQVSRHEGYETAFVEMSAMELTL